jgi:hypothetical protein
LHVGFGSEEGGAKAVWQMNAFQSVGGFGEWDLFLLRIVGRGELGGPNRGREEDRYELFHFGDPIEAAINAKSIAVRSPAQGFS